MDVDLSLPEMRLLINFHYSLADWIENQDFSLGESQV